VRRFLAELPYPLLGPVAQLVERAHGMREVQGFEPPRVHKRRVGRMAIARLSKSRGIIPLQVRVLHPPPNSII
jgi:hypothetical protein